MKRILTFAIAFLLVIAAVQAAMVVNKFTNDFSVSGPYDAEVKACSCENRAEQVTVTNTGGFYTSYKVDVVAEQPWYVVPREEFTLAPGDSRTVLVYAEPTCGAIGAYQYAIKVTSNFGRERLLTRTLDVRQCQNVFLTVTGQNASNLCQPIAFHARLKNVAEFPDTYHLDLGSFNDAKYEGGSPDTYLVPNEAKEFNITITPPCSLYGDIAIPFTVTSEKNRVTEQLPQHVFIQNQFDHEIVASTKEEICSRLPATYTFGVRNLINVSNTYDVIVTGTGFMNYDTKKLSLAGNEEKNVTVTLDPKKGDVGTYTLRIKVASDLGEIKKTRDVQLDVYDCFAYDVGFVSLPREKDGAYTDTSCCGEKGYMLNIRNAGQAKETYNIDVDGPTWFSPEEKTIQLEAGENRNVKFTAKLPCTDENYEIPVTVSLTKHPSISETVTFKVDSQTQQTCHAVEALADRMSIDEEAKVVPFLIRNTGIAGGVYTVDLSAELFNGTTEREITLEPGEEKVLHFPTKANLTDYFDGKYLGQLSVTYAPLNITYDEQFWTKLSHVSWLTEAWRSLIRYDYAALPACLWLGLLFLIVAGVALILLILLLSGRLRSLRTRAFTKTGLLITRTILILLLIAAILWLSLSPVPPKTALYDQPINDTSGLVFQWYENEQHAFDLSQYFMDADKDVLEFTATQPAHVGVLIEGGVATLTPEHNWAGTDKIVFTADDRKGGIMDSPILTLNVLQRHHLTFRQWLARYCHQVALGLAVAALLLLVLIAFLIRPRKEEAIEPPPKPGRKAVYTVVSKEGAVQRLGERRSKRVALKAKPGQVFTYVDEKGRTRTLGVAERLEWPERRRARRNLVRPGEAFTYTDSRGKVHTLGVAEKIAWPEPASRAGSAAPGAGKGATVNIAVGAPAAAAATAREPAEFVLVGAKGGNKVHDPQCVIAQRIPRKNRVTFTNKKDALKAGYGPCKVCQSFDRA
jgi:hypothetical protein